MRTPAITEMFKRNARMTAVSVARGLKCASLNERGLLHAQHLDENKKVKPARTCIGGLSTEVAPQVSYMMCR